MNTIESLAHSWQPSFGVALPSSHVSDVLVLDEVLWGGLVGAHVAHVDAAPRSLWSRRTWSGLHSTRATFLALIPRSAFGAIVDASRSVDLAAAAHHGERRARQAYPGVLRGHLPGPCLRRGVHRFRRDRWIVALGNDDLGYIIPEYNSQLGAPQPWVDLIIHWASPERPRARSRGYVGSTPVESSAPRARTDASAPAMSRIWQLARVRPSQVRAIERPRLV